MKRDFNYPILEEIQERWSPRAFAPEPIPEDTIYALVEAARYAPSCFNEQPWRFLIASKENELKIMRTLLNSKNQKWACRAPVLILIIAHRFFMHNGRENRWAQFDTGAAWGFLSLEAQRRGLITHAMAGFKRNKAREILNISDEYDIIATVAIGKMGRKECLEEEFYKEEFPNTRKAVTEIAWRLNRFID